MSLKKGDEIELVIESAAFQGKGLAKHEGLAVFVPSTAPGDKVLARIVRRKKNYREAKLLEVTEPSPRRIQPRCRHAMVCGGCTWQHVSYGDQLAFKEQHVRDHMERIAGLDPGIVLPIIGCSRDFYYRNKMEYSFGTRRWLTDEEISADDFVDDTGLVAGLHAPGRYDKILDLQECHLQHPVSFSILEKVRSYCLKNGITAYNSTAHTGYMRHLVIRNSSGGGYTPVNHTTSGDNRAPRGDETGGRSKIGEETPGNHTAKNNELMVNLVTNGDNPAVAGEIRDLLIDAFPEITTIINNINDQRNPTAVGRYENVLYGPGYINDRIGHHSFKIHANAFFQTNTPQAEILYSVAKDFLEADNNHHLYDLYCGVGTISLFMADAVKKVTGIEISEIAVKSAQMNAVENGVENVEFFVGDMKDTFSDNFLSGREKPDAIVTDPPRSGMHPDVVRQLLDLKVNRLVYVSCNPSTMARDLRELSSLYTIDSVQPVDMFPQTWHIEAVARLTLKTSRD